MIEEIKRNIKRITVDIHIVYFFTMYFLLVMIILGASDWYCLYGKTHQIMSIIYSQENIETYSQYTNEIEDYHDIPDWVYTKLTFINNDTKFTRYGSPKNTLIYRKDIPRLILESKVGKCEEFSIVAASIAYAKGYDVRIIAFMPPGDHTCIEIMVNGTWIHVDPSERLINDPFFYQRKNKTMGVVYAFTIDTCEDVTWKYSPS
ncbi:MAG: transglutaminase domain-containing protein [Promethearchaeota archaeon]